jgi:hypothetical protein
MPEKTTPTRSVDTLNNWSQRYDWPARAAEYDTILEDAKNARAEEIMNNGLALVHERTAKLQELAGFLEEQLYELGEEGVYHNVWVPDVKQIGSGEYAERVDLERFNAAIIQQFRATLDDLASETGGRVKKTALTDPTGEYEYTGDRGEIFGKLARITDTDASEEISSESD